MISLASHWSDALKPLRACELSIIWSNAYDSPKTAWAACNRGDWMLWVAGKLSGPPGGKKRKPLVAATCACARLGLKNISAGPLRRQMSRVLKVAEAWAHGQASRGDAREAAADAHAAAKKIKDQWYDVPNSVRRIPWKIVQVTSSVASAVDTVNSIFYAAAIAAIKATDIAGGRINSGRINLSLFADIVREHYPNPPKGNGLA